MKVAVYVPVPQERMLQAKGHDPALWVRTLVKKALEREAQRG